ncbi:MAG TPA: OmpA family protein [Myxococcales bacterium]|jgi:outer membrane protein OmpA-like peptidoglycan-associated protein
MSSLFKVALSSTVVAFLLLSPAAFAQNDDWSGFKPPPPPPTQPVEPAAAPKPAAKPAEPAASAKPADGAASTPDKPGYVPPPTVPVTTPDATPAAAPAKDAPALVDTKVEESIVPGTEPHSPGTYGHSITALDNARATSGVTGGTGLLRLGSADLGPAGLLRISITGEFFQQDDFPVLKASNTRSAGTLALDWTIIKYVAAYVSYGASANTNSKASPPLMQAQGDLRLGLKASLQAVKGFHIGADLMFIAFPGIGGQDLRKYAVGFAPRLLLTFDAQKYSPKAPIRLHVNFGGLLDSTGTLLDATTHKATPAEEFALSLNQYNRLSFGVGIEAPLPWVTPFVEYGLAYPLGTPMGTNFVGPDLKPVAVTDAMPQQLAIGLKVTAVKDLTITLAGEIGLTRYVALGIPATPPYNLYLGLSYAFDPMAKGQGKLVEKTLTYEKKVEVAVAPPVYTGKVAGQVIDADTKQAIAGVVVVAAGSGLPPVATDVEGGKFQTFDLQAGKVSLTFARDGYKPAVMEAAVEATKTTPLQVALVREVKPSPVKVLLVSGRQKAGGKIQFSGTKTAEMTVAAAGGVIELPAGHYTATVDADGFLSKVQEFDVAEGTKLDLAIELALKPKQGLVVIKDDRIQIKQQVHFATAKADILSDSFQLLDQVVDAAVRANVKKIRIDGHTDNQGGKEKNLLLSQARAKAVMDYLVKKGISASRISSEGYGDTRPIAPNLTARGRELNRRVEFVIVER